MMTKEVIIIREISSIQAKVHDVSLFTVKSFYQLVSNSMP